MDILSDIQKQYLSFPQKERLIADYILSGSTQLKNINISVLAGLVGVSNGTITRFCKRVGCSSFADLDFQISASAPEKAATETDSLMRVYDYYQQVVHHANRMMDRIALERITTAIRKAKFTYVYGIGSSGLTAYEFMLRLTRMGFRGQCITDTHLMIINSSIVSKKDLVIAFSVSGEIMEVVNAVAIARKNGCMVLGITSFQDSSLSQNVDYSFVVPNGGLIDKEHSFSTQFSFLYVIDLLTSIFLEDKSLKEKMNITIDTIVAQSHMKKS